MKICQISRDFQSEVVLSKRTLLCRLVRAGLLDKRHAKKLSRIGSWAELVGYAGTVSLNLLRIAASLEREWALRQELQRRKKVRCGSGCVWGCRVRLLFYS